MRRNHIPHFIVSSLWASLWLLFFPVTTAAATSPCQSSGELSSFPEIDAQVIVTGFTEPLGLTHAGDGSGRLFVIEQQGTIRVWKGDHIDERPFLDIRERVEAGGEAGLLGLAFHPKFPRDPRIFVNFTSRSTFFGLRTVIAEFTVTQQGTIVDHDSERVLMTIKQPYDNHNGGQIAFGPDGYLYIGMGDGGSSNDPHGNGQNFETLLGSMLRIDVNKRSGRKAYAIPPDNPFRFSDDAAPEVWAYGLRNPWRFSFDALTGDLYAGDVGQRAREEIDIIEMGKNYGWNTMEGMICTPGVDPECNQHGLELPILDYPRSEGTTVIGGYVYRGHAIPGLCGVYIYGDFGNGRVWGLRYDGTEVTDTALLLETNRFISSFGEGDAHELYLIDHSGEILKVHAVPPVDPPLPTPFYKDPDDVPRCVIPEGCPPSTEQD